MMNLKDWATQIVLGSKLQDKLIPPPIHHFDWDPIVKLPPNPSRENKIQFSEKQLKFPKQNNLNNPLNSSIALSAFANHELLAVEMMACAVLYYPHKTDEEKKFKIGLINTIKDEQKHFALYQRRMNDLGFEFGDFPLNNFFWKQMEKMHTPESFIATMSLTFEAANLDFACFYQNLFLSWNDLETAKILEIVYHDEISHVAFGYHYLNKWSKDQSLWDYYLKILPFPLTPARSKGIHYQELSRVKAGFSQDFINRISQYKDSFPVTKRKNEIIHR